MINHLGIKNFKSIKNLGLTCKKINLLIGEPNTGKSNILEALGIFSFKWYGSKGFPLSSFVRFETLDNLFYDGVTANKIEIQSDNNFIKIFLENEIFRMDFNNSSPTRFILQGNLHGMPQGWVHDLSPFKYYKFIPLKNFPRRESGFLMPPNGENLLSVIAANETIKEDVKEFFESYGFRINLKTHESKIEILKEVKGIFNTYPYYIISDTFQRIIFYMTAIDSNTDSIIILEEPESHAFPYYIKYLAERIALDKNKNQFFIATHNPYMVLSILEKAHKDDVGIFVTYTKDYETKCKSLSEKEIRKVLDDEMDLFLNIDRFIEET